MEIRKAYDLPNFKCQVVDYDYILEHFMEFDIKNIVLDASMQINDKFVEYCDVDHPIVYTNGYFQRNTLTISGEYYKANKEKIDNLVTRICSHTNSDAMAIKSTALISDDCINVMIGNENIELVTLGSSDDIYELDLPTYDRIKGTHITKINTYAVCPELENNFDPLIDYNVRRYLIGMFNYESLTTATYFYFSNPVNEQEIENIKYLNEEAEVNIKFKQCNQVSEIINRLRELGRTQKIIINIEEKNPFNKYLLEHINEFKSLNNVFVNNNGREYDISTYLKYEKRLIEFIAPAMGLSPFEKYLYAYNITKQFKEYKESKENSQSSRDLYQILDNNYMVCVGYSKLLGDLLDKLGIENYEHSVTVEVGLDNVPLDATVLPDYIEKNGEKHEVLIDGEGHARRKVHLVDPKYGIDGYYIADPTWDNDLQHDTYNYALMTIDEFVGTDRYNYFRYYTHDELFFVHSLEEFYQKLNILLDKNPKKTIFDFINGLYYEFSALDKEFVAELKSKYPLINSYDKKNMTKEEIQDLLLDIGEHIVERSNNLVDGFTFKEGIRVLYENLYGYDEENVEKYLEETMDYNKKRQAKAFPPRYKVDKNGIEMVVLNPINKFETEEIKEIRAA